MGQLNAWDSFFVIVGSASGGLIGLQFVVMTLIAQRPPPRAEGASSAFASPTIVHFCAALFLSAVLRAPWETMAPPAIIVGLVGFTGAIYEIVVARRMKRQSAYEPDFEDWVFHLVLPFGAYVALLLSGLGIGSLLRDGLFVVGAAILVLLFVGIHNSWDAVSYHVLVGRRTDTSGR